MNQGIPFARTIRALDADDFRGSKLGLLLAALVLGCWLWWAFTATVPRYELATNVQLDPASQTAVAYFRARSGLHIRAGQSAIFRAGNASVGAAVTAATATSDGQIRVDLQLLQPAAALAGPITVELEIERITPATIAFRAAGIGDP